MPNTYFDSDLTGEQIEAALSAIHGVVTPENNGKVLAIEDGEIVAKSASEWTDTPVTVYVDGGQRDWRDSFAVNWDFSHPVNTRGAASYSASSLIYTIDGWQLQDGILEFATVGIRLSRRTAGTAGYFMQRFKRSMTTAIVGQTMTLSAMVDGDVAFATAAPIPSASGDSGFGFYCGGVSFRGYGYGSEIALSIDIGTDTSDHIIQAIKLEAGNTQTLATQVNGVWVLNNSMDTETEYIKARNGTVYNS